MQTLKKLKVIIIFQLIFPLLAFAETGDPRGTIGNMMDVILGILNVFVVPTIVTLATAVFIWGIIQYVLAGGSDTRKKEAKNLIIWGLVGLFAIVAMWGIVKVIGKTFGLSDVGIPTDELKLR